jgi:NADH-quinone oxidoreductase subunit J
VTGLELAFYVLGGLAVASTVLVVSSRNPIASLLYLVVSFFSVAGLFATLEAHFLAAIQVLIYAGAILVLFLFVIMLLNLGTGEVWPALKRPFALTLGALAAAGFVVILVLSFRGTELTPARDGDLVGSTEAIGAALFRDFLLPFEVTSLLLLVAMVGAVMLGKRER